LAASRPARATALFGQFLEGDGDLERVPLAWVTCWPVSCRDGTAQRGKDFASLKNFVEYDEILPVSDNLPG
jgi:hypothetical protein